MRTGSWGFFWVYPGYPRSHPSALSGAAGSLQRAPSARVAAGLVDQRRVSHFFNFVNLTKMWLTACMFIPNYAIYVLLACNLAVFCYALYAHARVVATDKALQKLDWETIVNLTGEMATVKKSIQKLSNRLNGMNNADPQQILADLPQLQNVTQPNGRIGG